MVLKKKELWIKLINWIGFGIDFILNNIDYINNIEIVCKISKIE